MPSGVYERSNTDKKGRGNPNMAKIMAEARKKQLEILMNKKYMKPAPAAKLVDKNARTMAKLLQLLEIQAKDKNGIVTEPVMQRRIDKLKKTISRRLTKLARYQELSIPFSFAYTHLLTSHYRWGDAPEGERSFSEYNKYKNNYGHNIQIKAVPVAISKGHPSAIIRKTENTGSSFDFGEEKGGDAEEKTGDAEEKAGDADENMELSV